LTAEWRVVKMVGSRDDLTAELMVVMLVEQKVARMAA